MYNTNEIDAFKRASIFLICALVVFVAIALEDSRENRYTPVAHEEYLEVENPIEIGYVQHEPCLLDNIKKYVKNESRALEYMNLILDNSEKTGVDAMLIARVIAKESSFRPQVVSHVGAQGLMQVMPNWKLKSNGDVTWTRSKRPNVDLSHPAINVEMGTKILAHYLARYDSLERALAAYNGSKGTTRYHDAVMAIF